MSTVPNQNWDFTIQNLVWENLFYIIGAFVILICRHLLTKFVFLPIGSRFGLRDSKTGKFPVNPTFDGDFSKILGLSRRLDVSRAEDIGWSTSSQNEAAVLRKFADSCWRFCYYSLELSCGCVVLSNKAWFWDISQCWNDLQNQTIPSDLWWFCTLFGSYAFSELFHLVYDVKRKYFFAMATHHVVVVLVYLLGARSNMFRIGACMTFVTSLSVPFLEISKMAKYLGYEKLALCVFLQFSAVWLIVRLGLHPFWLLNSFIVAAPKIISPRFTQAVYYALLGLVAIILLLNGVWSYFVIKSVVHIFVSGKGEDLRAKPESKER